MPQDYESHVPPRTLYDEGSRNAAGVRAVISERTERSDRFSIMYGGRDAQMLGEWLDPRRERAVVAPANGAGAARRAIAVGLRQRHEHERDRRFLTGLIDAIDAVLDDLEHLHLLDLRRVPDSYTTRLERLSARLPADELGELRSGVPIAQLMESLYTIQGRLMALRSGRTVDASSDDAAPLRSASGGPWVAYL